MSAAATADDLAGKREAAAEYRAALDAAVAESKRRLKDAEDALRALGLVLRADPGGSPLRLTVPESVRESKTRAAWLSGLSAGELSEMRAAAFVYFMAYVDVHFDECGEDLRAIFWVLAPDNAGGWEEDESDDESADAEPAKRARAESAVEGG